MKSKKIIIASTLIPLSLVGITLPIIGTTMNFGNSLPIPTLTKETQSNEKAEVIETTISNGQANLSSSTEKDIIVTWDSTISTTLLDSDDNPYNPKLSIIAHEYYKDGSGLLDEEVGTPVLVEAFLTDGTATLTGLNWTRSYQIEILELTGRVSGLAVVNETLGKNRVTTPSSDLFAEINNIESMVIPGSNTLRMTWDGFLGSHTDGKLINSSWSFELTEYNDPAGTVPSGAPVKTGQATLSENYKDITDLNWGKTYKIQFRQATNGEFDDDGSTIAALNVIWSTGNFITIGSKPVAKAPTISNVNVSITGYNKITATWDYTVGILSDGTILDPHVSMAVHNGDGGDYETASWGTLVSLSRGENTFYNLELNQSFVLLFDLDELNFENTTTESNQFKQDLEDQLVTLNETLKEKSLQVGETIVQAAYIENVTPAIAESDFITIDWAFRLGEYFSGVDIDPNITLTAYGVTTPTEATKAGESTWEYTQTTKLSNTDFSFGDVATGDYYVQVKSIDDNIDPTVLSDINSKLSTGTKVSAVYTSPGLSIGAIVGISIGSVVAAGLIAFGIWWYFKKVKA